MSRILTVAGAQMGPIARKETRESAVARMLAMMEKAHRKGVRYIVFPELALTTFFPRWFVPDAEADRFFEDAMPNAATRPLFEAAARLKMGFNLGYAELTKQDGRVRHFNTSVLVDETGRIVGKYRKVHLPGHSENDPKTEWQHLEKRYFEPGDLGFPVFRAFGGLMGMCICNDRRWPETFRVMGMQDVEMVTLGYNTPVRNRTHREPEHLRMFHNWISMQAGAYQNGTWVVGVAKAGMEEGVDMMAGSCIVAPTGEIVAQATTDGDELIVYDCDLDQGRYVKDTVFNFAAHRRIEHYGLITARTGAEPPA